MDEKLQGFTEQMEQQAAGIQETTATIEEIQANIKQVAEVSSRNTNSGLELQKLSKEKETLFDNVQDSVLNVTKPQRKSRKWLV
jgi:methyl-accepting chemotaxis protein